jgi:ribosomal protein L11 methylase PrmA
MDFVLASTLLLLVVALFLAYVFLGGFISGAGYQPTPRSTLETMFEFSQPDETRKVFDLGSGFGRIVIEVAERFRSDCTGVEVDPMKVWWSRRSIRKRGLESRARVVRGNLMSADISKADIVYVFLWEGIMQRLREKVLREMKPGSVVVSYYHRFAGWQPEREDKDKRVYLYRVPAKR